VEVVAQANRQPQQGYSDGGSDYRHQYHQQVVGDVPEKSAEYEEDIGYGTLGSNQNSGKTDRLTSPQRQQQQPRPQQLQQYEYQQYQTQQPQSPIRQQQQVNVQQQRNVQPATKLAQIQPNGQQQQPQNVDSQSSTTTTTANYYIQRQQPISNNQQQPSGVRAESGFTATNKPLPNSRSQSHNIGQRSTVTQHFQQQHQPQQQQHTQHIQQQPNQQQFQQQLRQTTARQQQDIQQPKQPQHTQREQVFQQQQSQQPQQQTNQTKPQQQFNNVAQPNANAQSQQHQQQVSQKSTITQFSPHAQRKTVQQYQPQPQNNYHRIISNRQIQNQPVTSRYPSGQQQPQHQQHIQFDREAEMSESLPRGHLSNSYANTSGKFRDSQGYDVNYIRELTTSTNADREMQLLKQEESRVIDEPLREEPELVASFQAHNHQVL